ncbi:hypothetical protein [Bradyrhizobium sp.]|jgi:hypothetical protein|uniref:hypothetical protein n=1 Tax=Bradyrhizobium sp. TaxID=376 RepID=UPI002E03651D|nr:hypothetical protein [Bradyrhizobium sp.]
MLKPAMYNFVAAIPRVVKMQIAFRHAGIDLCFVKRASETVSRPRPAPAAGQDRGRALGDAREDIAKRAIQWDDRMTRARQGRTIIGSRILRIGRDE